MISFIALSFLSILLIGYMTALFLVFIKMNHFLLLSPFDAVDVLTDPYFLSEIIALIAVVTSFFILYKYIKSEYTKYLLLKEQRIYSVSLQELARIWGAGKIDIAPKETVPVLYLKNFGQERTKEFISKYMEKNIRFFPTEKLEIIFELLKILEAETIEISSVASMFKNDPEKTGNYQSVITPDGKTSYDVFSEITLFDHTMNVAEKAIEYLKEKDPISFETILCDGIIVALAHDIGKLKKIKQFNKEYPPEILQQNPHHAISKMFFSEMWPGYSSIEDAIYNHHSAPNSNALLTRMIIHADKEARKAELLAWQTKRSEKNRNSTDDIEVIFDKANDLKAQVENEEIEDKSTEDVPTVIKPKPSRKAQKQKQKQSDISENDSVQIPQDVIEAHAEETENESNEEKQMIIAAPIPDEPLEREYPKPLEIPYDDDIEAKIIADLKLAINVYTLEQAKGIHSISYNDTILFSILQFNKIVQKHIYTNGDEPDEIKRIGMYIAGKFCEKGYTQYISRDIGCSTFYLSIKNKPYKFICVPLKAEIFNLDASQLDSMKDSWIKAITVSDHRNHLESL